MKLKESDILQAARIPGFDEQLIGHRMRLTSSGWSEFFYRKGFGDSVQELQFEHQFSQNELDRVRILLDQLSLPQPRTSIIDDSPEQILLYRMDHGDQNITIYENRSEEDYADRDRFDEIWKLIHSPLTEKLQNNALQRISGSGTPRNL
jgi:hypothetical protein